jgi:type II secretory ATPase GspE/PulE/Tfp pilus assembly ATPase PilB-like protein
MGAAAFLITATVNAIIAQRLVRKICEHCKKEIIPEPAIEEKLRKAIKSMNPDQREKLGFKDNEALKIYHGEGCEACGQTGYKGRIGLYEILEMTNSLKDLILKNGTPFEIEQNAIAAGMRTLEHDGVEKILAGITTPEEVYSVARATEDKSKNQNSNSTKSITK